VIKFLLWKLRRERHRHGGRGGRGSEGSGEGFEGMRGGMFGQKFDGMNERMWGKGMEDESDSNNDMIFPRRMPFAVEDDE